MKTRSQSSYCIGPRVDKSGRRSSVRNQAEVEKCASGTKLPTEDSLKGHQNCVKKNLDPQKHQNHQTKMTLKDKNGHRKNTEKSWKPTTTQNITPQMKVILNKHIKSGEKRT